MSSTKEKAPTAAKLNESLPNTSENDFSTSSAAGKVSPFYWSEYFELTEEQANELGDPTWIIPNVVIAGHLIVIAAEPNAGKTTIFSHLAGEMVKAEQQVFYVNADISGTDVKYAHSQATSLGYRLLLPDFTVDLDIKTLGKYLKELAEDDVNLRGSVIIIDTLKKLIDVQNKSQLKQLMKLFRKLTAKGMTVVFLAHTNKHKDDDGNPIFEGTGDVRSDVDELIYLIPHKNEDGSMLVHTKPDKVRGSFKELAFHISPDRVVSLSEDSEKAQQEIRVNQELSADAEVINCIKSVLNERDSNQKKLIEACQLVDIPIRRAKEVIPKYDGSRTDLPVLWKKSKGQGKTIIYSLNS